jgi:hypothetical protein
MNSEFVGTTSTSSSRSGRVEADLKRPAGGAAPRLRRRDAGCRRRLAAHHLRWRRTRLSPSARKRGWIAVHRRRAPAACGGPRRWIPPSSRAAVVARHPRPAVSTASIRATRLGRGIASPRTHSSRRDRPHDPSGMNPGGGRPDCSIRTISGSEPGRPAAGGWALSLGGCEINNTFGAACASVLLALVAAIGAREVQPGHGRPASPPPDLVVPRFGFARSWLPECPSQELQRDNGSVCPAR